MYNKDSLIQILFDQGMLWDGESFQEAKELLLKIYELEGNLRPELIKLIITGPKDLEKEPDKEKISIEENQCVLIEAIREKSYKIFDEGEKFLTHIYKKHPDWEPKSQITEESPVRRKNIDDMSPKEIIDEFLINKPDDKYINRKAPETIGVKCSKNYDFCNDLFELLLANTDHLSSSFVSPIIWGIRPDPESHEIKWSKDEQNSFVILLAKLIESKPDAETWNSLPSLFEMWQKIQKVVPIEWTGLLFRLGQLFLHYDPYTKKTDQPIAWIQDAINHPYGKLTQVYFNIAVEEIKQKKKERKKLGLSKAIIDFFNFTITNYAVGSRYGLCLISRNLVWLMSIDLEWAENNLVHIFKQEYSSERFLVAWSGYLWGSISNSLIFGIESTYQKIADRYSELDRDEKMGFVNHIAHIFWFGKSELKNLFKLSIAMDTDSRENLIYVWKNYLERTQHKKTKEFWTSTLFPFWEWNCKQSYFMVKKNKKLKFAFWHFIPYSKTLFPKAVEIAINNAPQKLDHPGFLKNILNTDYIEKYPKEYVDLAIAFLNALENPEWQKNEWLKQWDILKSLKVRKLKTLENILAQKGIL